MNDKILIDRAVVERALKALESCDAQHASDGGRQFYDDALVEPAITALRAALTEATMQRLTDTHKEIDAALEQSGQEQDWKALYHAQVQVTEAAQRRADRAQSLMDSALEQQEQEPVAWRTFDLEGGYDYRTYDDNENYRDEWDRRNPNHKGWVEPLYKNPTPCETCQALARTVLMDQTGYDMAPRREWVGLTDEEHTQIAIDSGCMSADWVFYGAAVERKVKEKNF
jgi:hypothetical protein